jgi:cysteine synthase B
MALETTIAGVTALVGNTPLVQIHLFDAVNPDLRVYAKLEWFNPGGSVKDRAALAMIEDGERRGELRPGKTIIDSTSGNTGVAYAMVGAAKGYPVQLVMPENVSRERKELVLAYGAQPLYTDPMEGSDGAIRRCRDLVAADPDRYFYPDQYNNPANPEAHRTGTAQEILRQVPGRVTHFVAGLGTTGTFMGTATGLKAALDDVVAIAVQPQESFHGLEGLKHLPSAIVPGIWRSDLADQVWGAPTEPAYALVSRLAREEGLLAGHSSGAALWAIERLARRGEHGVVATVFPDGGDRYLSSGRYQAGR